jgi:hypothetical protein
VKITTVTIGYGATQSLPEYSNVKPSAILTAEVEDGEDPTIVAAQLQTTARLMVENEIDAVLERNGQPAKYSTELRYRVWAARRPGAYEASNASEQVVIIVPAKDFDRHAFRELYEVLHDYSERWHRYRYALTRAMDYATEHTARLIDCSDGDLSRIPEVFRRQPEPVAVPAIPAAQDWDNEEDA